MLLLEHDFAEGDGKQRRQPGNKEQLQRGSNLRGTWKRARTDGEVRGGRRACVGEKRGNQEEEDEIGMKPDRISLSYARQGQGQGQATDPNAPLDLADSAG